ncbi:MAG: butanol dehydrogenase [Elusimicrobia bacterium GWF2_52_66]|nr:MAG: butanol dehydrogenase [Elusimicrobia bacterium GWA2_51_34]OGR86583.1 MAG: butanol dehydrogenase [Elusimicrobia bacterium GWF2_52_66]HAF95634.1 NADH-dependent alcohol dehydrogenase [Elusimicrobiota bacterium]HCE97675.1 NADH-dependent alcohol dehydrogenase [Elusimicrobiota bacterium]
MKNFTFYNPVKIIFGKGTIEKIGAEAAVHGKTALLVYGKGSIKKNGVYAAVTQSLKASGLAFVEHEGVKSNPVLAHTREGIKKARENKCDLVIAAGGGSVIDESKAIAAGFKYSGDVWDFFSGKTAIKDAMPLLTVLTIPATGSEMNCGFVITNEETSQKFNAASPCSFPKVSIMDPLVTITLPKTQTANGAVDALAHIVEGYFTTKDKDAAITDELVHAIARSVIAGTDRILANPEDYNARASMMWSATLALNGLQALGYGGGSFINHAIEHSLSALYDIAHGAGLAIVMPAWFKYDLKISGPERLAKFGRSVFGVAAASDKEAAERTIASFEKWFSKIGAPLKLSEVKIPAADIPKIAENAMGLITKWGIDCDRTSVEDILRKAV